MVFMLFINIIFLFPYILEKKSWFMTSFRLLQEVLTKLVKKKNNFFLLLRQFCNTQYHHEFNQRTQYCYYCPRRPR